MALRNSAGKYLCSICTKEFRSFQEADACRDSHQMLYVPLTQEELNRIVNFFYLKDDSLIKESLVKKLQAYARHKPLD